MLPSTQFTIGADASCTDGACGDVTRLVIDPVSETVTHLVVEPKHRPAEGRLVPIALVNATAATVRLQCTLQQFDQLDPAEEIHFLPQDDGYSGYDREQSFVWPYYSTGGLGTGMWSGTNTGLGTGGDVEPFAEPVTTDTVPIGEVTVQRGDRVHATDGEIGRVRGLVITPDSHHVSHVLLQEGHLFGRKEVAIPIGAVTDVTDGIRLNIAKGQVQDLPPVDLDPPTA